MRRFPNRYSDDPQAGPLPQPNHPEGSLIGWLGWGRGPATATQSHFGDFVISV